MELNAENVREIFNRNFGIQTRRDDIVGPVIPMSAKDAYLYAAITGSFYLNDSIPFRTRGLFPLFNHANCYNLVTGLMTIDKNRPYFFNSPLIHKKQRPFIANGSKYIIFKELKKSSDSDYRRVIFDSLKAAGKNPSDYLITEIRKDVKGYGMEPFCEYIACKYFSNKGYIVENQIPLFYGIGTPDFGAFQIPELMESLASKKLIQGGCFLIELASLRIFGKPAIADGKYNYTKDFVVGEAKTCTNKTQIQKYINTRLYNRCFEIIPDKCLAEKYSGLILFNDKGQLIIKESPRLKVESNKQQAYIDWLYNYIKYYLLSNLTNEELFKFLEKEMNKSEWDRREFIEFINAMPFEEIIKQVDKKLS